MTASRRLEPIEANTHVVMVDSVISECMMVGGGISVRDKRAEAVHTPPHGHRDAQKDMALRVSMSMSWLKNAHASDGIQSRGA